MLYLGYLYFNLYREDYGEKIRQQVVAALNDKNVDDHIPLDGLAYYTGFSQDVCIVIISVYSLNFLHN